MKQRTIRNWLLFAAVGLVFLFAGWWSRDAGLGLPINSTTSPSAGILKGPHSLAFDKVQVDLATLEQDQQTTQSFLVMNFGNNPLRIGQVSVQAEQGCDVTEAFVADTEPLKPGEAGLVFVKTGPHKKLGPHRLTLNVSSNDVTMPIARLSVSFTVSESAATASVGGPRLRVDKEMIDIGTVPNDWPLYEEYTLRNDGDSPLVLAKKPEARVEEGC